MTSTIDILYLLKEIGTSKERLDENQVNRLREIRNSVIDEFEKFYKPSEMVLNYIDKLLEVKSFNKRRELSIRLKCKIKFLATWRFLIDELIL